MKDKIVPCDLFLNKIPLSQVPEIIQGLWEDESWWDRNVEARMTEFEKWIGDPSSPSKVIVRQYVAKMNYKSILDCGCGLCSEYYGYKLGKYDIAYTGLDQCQKLVDKSLSEGIAVVCGSVDDIPFHESWFEVSFARHVLEHVMGYEKTLSEMIRVASKKVIVVFFIPPVDTVPPSSDCLRYDVVEGVWHNVYQKERMEGFLRANPKVEKFEWSPLPDLKESILYVDLKKS